MLVAAGVEMLGEPSLEQQKRWRPPLSGFIHSISFTVRAAVLATAPPRGAHVRKQAQQLACSRGLSGTRAARRRCSSSGLRPRPERRDASRGGGRGRRHGLARRQLQLAERRASTAAGRPAQRGGGAARCARRRAEVTRVKAAHQLGAVLKGACRRRGSCGGASARPRGAESVRRARLRACTGRGQGGASDSGGVIRRCRSRSRPAVHALGQAAGPWQRRWTPS